MYKIIDGKEVSNKHFNSLKEKINDKKIKLVIIKASNSEEVEKYALKKIRMCTELNMEVEYKEYNEKVKEKNIVSDIEKYNKDKNINGIIVELPLYNHLDDDRIINSISFEKDVDGLTNENISRLANNDKCFIPSTVKGILSLIDYYKIDINNKKVTIINRGRLIGKPLYYYLMNKNIDVNMIGSTTVDIKKICKSSDILITGIGKREVIDKTYIKENAVVIDAGICIEYGKVFGDTNFNDIKDLCSYISKVPGGVGPMTVISLFENLYEAYIMQNKE